MMTVAMATTAVDDNFVFLAIGDVNKDQKGPKQ